MASKCATVVALTVAMVAAIASATEKPNIVVIYGDDIGYGDIGCYGAKTIPTPHTDRLAAGGVRFTSAYASSATCTPSRYSMLTGEYAFRKPGTGIAAPNATAIIRPGRTTLASMLKKAGYATAVVGKWHLGLGVKPKPNWGGEIKPGPLEIGFDYCFLMPTTGDRVPCVYLEDHRLYGVDPSDPVDVTRGNLDGQPTGVTMRNKLKMDWSHGHNSSVVNGISRIGFMTGGKTARWRDEDMADDFVGKAVAFIERSKDKPFFLFFATHDIHVPRVPHQRFVGKSPHGPRGDAVVQFDYCVGQLVRTLAEHGLAENTLIILSSDNGPVLNDGYKDLANEKLGDHKPAGPFRAGKYSIFEGGTRMPFIVNWPKRVKSGGTSDAIVGQIDLLASLAALTGQPLADADAPDSINVLSALLGESKTGRDHIIQHARQLAIRAGRWKYIPQAGGIRDNLGPWTKVKAPETGFLFDLAVDPGETTNLASKNPEKVKELDAKLKAIRTAGRSR